MTRVDLTAAKDHLHKLIERVQDGEEVVLTSGDEPVARLVAIKPSSKGRRSGSARGQIEFADDFDAPLDDFAEYT